MPKGELLFIGLGLYDESDISLRGLREIKKCDKVFAEFYTSKLVGAKKQNLEKTIGKPINVLSREETESGKIILDAAENNMVAFLVCGDPMMATTHVDLRLRAIEKNIPTKIIHGSSIITAVPGLLGLQNYKFGRTTTLAFPENEYFPTSPYELIKENKKMGLHTLILLDIQADKDVYMSANEGIDLLLQMEKKIGAQLFNEDSILCIVARAGSENPTVVANTIKKLQKTDFGPPLHTIVIPGNLHFMEIESLIKVAGLPKDIAKKLQKL